MSARLEKRLPPGSPPHERHSAAGAGLDAPPCVPVEAAMNTRRARAEKGAASFMAGILSPRSGFPERNRLDSARDPVAAQIQQFPYVSFRGSPLDRCRAGFRVRALLGRR